MADDDSTGTESERPVALVTGASAGIGEQFARYLGAGGHDLVLVARDRARLEALAKDLDADHGARAEVLAADLTDPEELERVEGRVSSTEAPVDLLVNNAGFGTIGRFDRIPVDREVDEIELNVIAVVRLAHAAVPAMVSRGHGAILNVSSLASRQPTPNMATYAGTKAFVSSFSQSLHVELKEAGVHVMVLEPGFTRTEFQDRLGVGRRGRPRPRVPVDDPRHRRGGCTRGSPARQGRVGTGLDQQGHGRKQQHDAGRRDAQGRGRDDEDRLIFGAKSGQPAGSMR